MKKGADAPASPSKTTHHSLMPNRKTVGCLELTNELSREVA